MHVTTQRDSVIDLIRATALLLVVLVHTHTGPLSTDTVSSITHSLVFFLGKLGVPLFVMISGALLLSKTQSTTTFYWKRVKKIFIPWITWGTPLFGYKVATGLLVTTSFTTLAKVYLVTLLSDFWFIPMIIGVYLIKPYLQVVVQSFKLDGVLMFWFVFLSVLPSLQLSPLFPGSASAGLVSLTISYSGYFLLGWYLKKNCQQVPLHVLLGLLVVAAGLYLGGIHVAPTPAQVQFATHDYFAPGILLGSAAVFLILHRYDAVATTFQQQVTKLAHMSYGIFLSHVLILQLLTHAVPQLSHQPSTVLSWLLNTVLVYSSTAVVMAVLLQVPLVRKVVT